MIKVQIRDGEAEARLILPNDEETIEATIQGMMQGKKSDNRFALDCVLEPQELKYLESMVVDLDELNFLAKRMDSFDDQEMKRFLTAAETDTPLSLKNLINLTYNLQRYTLVGNLSDIAAVGKTHLLCRQGGLSMQEAENTDFEKIGRELLRSGTGTITEHGILFRSPDLPFEEVYDGRNFPEYVYNSDWMVSIAVGYEGREEYLYLPTTAGAIDRAAARLGAPDIGPCTVDITDTTFDCEAMEQRFHKMLREEGLKEVNQVLDKLKEFYYDTDDWEKLDAVARYMDVEYSGDIVFLACSIEKFHYFADVDDFESLGRKWIENYTDYSIDPDLEDFFDYYSYGEMIADSNCGEFLVGEDKVDGFVCMADDMLKSKLEAQMNQGREQMGGMQL